MYEENTDKSGKSAKAVIVQKEVAHLSACEIWGPSVPGEVSGLRASLSFDTCEISHPSSRILIFRLCKVKSSESENWHKEL